MQGAGNDFVVLDETAGLFGLTSADYRFLGDRHFGVGADQILTVRLSGEADVDFEYLIHNADGAQVEQCGNGARCFARYVHERGLSRKTVLRVKTQKGIITPRLTDDGRVCVDMGAPRFATGEIPMDSSMLTAQVNGDWTLWHLALPPVVAQGIQVPTSVLLAAVSMGNPHAVLQVADVDAAPVQIVGPQVQQSACFTAGVNVGFMQVLDRAHIRLRVYERGVGETLACGSGACAAVVAGIRLGLLDNSVHVQTRGGNLTIGWNANAPLWDAPVQMTGPATTVFQGEIELPDRQPCTAVA